MFKTYWYNHMVIISQWVSVWFGGHPDHSISERTGKAYLAHVGTGTKKEKWFTIQLKCIDIFMYCFTLGKEINHTIDSVTSEDKAKELWDWSRK